MVRRRMMRCCLMMLVVLIARGAAARPPVAALPDVTSATDLFGDCDHPLELLALTRAHADTDLDLTRALMEVRDRFPELFGITAGPAGPVRLPGPFERSSTLVLAYPALDEYDDWFGELVAETVVEGRVVILVDAQDREALLDVLYAHGVSAGEVTLIDDIPFESVWIRDYGPIAVETATGAAVIDPRYFVNCLYNDAVPTHLALELGDLPIYRPPLWLEGGDLLSNGAGTCFSTVHSARRNGLDERAYRDLLAAYFGCEHTILLHPLSGNAAEHVDLFLAVAAEDRLLLAEFDPAEDPVNAALMDMNEVLLDGQPTADGGTLRVDRVPMPPPVLQPRDPAGPLIRSYLNLVVFNGAVFVPVYPADAQREADALRVIRRAFADRRIVPLPVESLALDEGALHCATVTLPAARRSP